MAAVHLHISSPQRTSLQLRRRPPRALPHPHVPPRRRLHAEAEGRFARRALGAWRAEAPQLRRGRLGWDRGAVQREGCQGQRGCHLSSTNTPPPRTPPTSHLTARSQLVASDPRFLVRLNHRWPQPAMRRIRVLSPFTIRRRCGPLQEHPLEHYCMLAPRKSFGPHLTCTPTKAYLVIGIVFNARCRNSSWTLDARSQRAQAREPY